jgi:thiaminase/transcriptional activator TenA
MNKPTLTSRLWSSIEPIFARILEHPFLKGLSDGSLERDAFVYYVVQDAHYLRQYARALSLLSSRAATENDILIFSKHAGGAIEVERALHESFFADFGMSEADVASTPMAPTNLAYTSYLLSTVSGGSYPEGVAVVLPCYWIYWEVGKLLLASGSPNQLFQRWIDTYGGEEFGDIVQEVLWLTDRLESECSPGEQARMTEHFVTTSRYEWMFWDMGYRKEAWPI